MGPEGIEPSPNGLKVRHAACYTTTPNVGWAYAFQSQSAKCISCFFLSTVNWRLSTSSSGSPEDRTQRDPRIRRIWATSPRLPLCQKVGHLGVEPRPFLLPKQACFHLHLYPMLFVVFAADDSVGAYLPCQWAGRRSNPRLRFFRPPLDRLSYQPMLGLFLVSPVQCGHEKRPDVCVTSGLDERRFERSRRHMRKRYAGASLFRRMLPPKKLPSCICSSRLDWNFDNMELSARL